MGLYLINKKISTTYRKNRDDAMALLSGAYPHFVYRNSKKLKTGEIPVFTFHSVVAEEFEAQLKYLYENNYKTLTAKEFYDVLTGGKKPHNRMVVLTFDDGHGSLWSVANPLLKKYGYKAISFILPGIIKTKSVIKFPTLQEVWSGKASQCEIETRESKEPLCTWEEIQQIHSDGMVDFQSHTSYHNSIFTSEKIVDFVSPSFDDSYLNSTFHPIVRINSKDLVPEILELGQPIYQWAPMMSSKSRYVEDQNLSEKCIEYVRNNGGKVFFKRKKWKEELMRYVSKYRLESSLDDHFLPHRQRFSEIYKDLLQSKISIEKNLKKEVLHLCFPWYVGSDMAVEASKEAGYVANYWGIFKDRAYNRVSQSPYYIARMNDLYIFSLPGKKRVPLPNLLLHKIIGLLKK